MTMYRIAMHVSYELVVGEMDNPTPSIWDQAVALTQRKLEALKVSLPEEVITALTAVNGRQPQIGNGRFLMKDYEVHCEEMS